MNRSNNQLNSKWLLYFFSGFIGILVILGIGSRWLSSHQQTQLNHESLTLIDSAGQVDPRSEIELGVRVENIYNFDAGQRTFDADGFVWLKWSATLQKRLHDANLTAGDLIDFYNQVGDWDTAIKATSDAPQVLADGRLYQRFSYSGHFYANDLDFRMFPFQSLRLPMVVELNALKVTQRDQPLVLRLDQQNSGIGDYIDISGYLTRDFSFRAYRHQLKSSFGDPVIEADGQTRQQARLEVSYFKSPVAIVMKIILPLLTIMGLSLAAPSISSTGWDVRVGVPPTSILTLMFLQQTYQGWLPDLPYVTYLDTIYNVCYLINFILFCLFLWGTNEYSSAAEDQKERVVERIDRMDRRFQFGLSFFLLTAMTANWFWMLMHAPR
jgi:hypothetical protein